MRRTWMLLIAALASMVLLVGAVACNDDDDDTNGDVTPLATEPLDEPTEPEMETPEDSETPSEDGTPMAGGSVTVTEHADLGPILTDAEGNTLYTFDNDTEGVSNCNEGCIGLWPAFSADGEPTSDVPGTLDTIERSDGTTQVTYDGQPLYYFGNDTQPGDAMGDGFGGIWHVVSISQ